MDVGTVLRRCWNSLGGSRFPVLLNTSREQICSLKYMKASSGSAAEIHKHTLTKTRPHGAQMGNTFEGFLSSDDPRDPPVAALYSPVFALGPVSADQPSGVQEPFSFRRGDAHLHALGTVWLPAVRRRRENDGLNMLIVECEMFAAHMNNLGSSAVDQSGARDLNVLRGAKICLIGGEGSLNRG